MAKRNRVSCKKGKITCSLVGRLVVALLGGAAIGASRRRERAAMSDVVYVTGLRQVLPKRPGWRYAKAAHLWSASGEVLEGFAKQLRLNKSWRHNDHYDITENKWRQALRLGAVSITERDLIRLRKQRSKT